MKIMNIIKKVFGGIIGVIAIIIGSMIGYEWYSRATQTALTVEACSVQTGQALNLFNFVEKYYQQGMLSVEQKGGPSKLFFKSRKVLASDMVEYEKMTGKVRLTTTGTPLGYFYCHIDLEDGIVKNVKASAMNR